MCEYCRNAASGDDWFGFGSADVDIGALGMLDMEMAIENEGCAGNDPVLVMYLSHMAGSSSGTMNKCSKVKISYCPMCGQKLRK